VKKIKIGVIFGGCSPEHQISLLSASNILKALDSKKYEVIPIGIDKTGKWLLADKNLPMLDVSHPSTIHLNKKVEQELFLIPGRKTELQCLDAGLHPGCLDVIFPVLHGPLGEDGTIQGLLQFVGIPCVGSGVLSSAVCMDKEMSKCLLKQLGIPTPDFLCFRTHENGKINYQKVIEKLGSPVFVKPANAGSSVGTHKVREEEGFHKAVADAFLYDHKILVEQAIVGREIEVAVLGNDNPKASVPGEAIPNDEFYTYKAKYEENGVVFVVPAQISKTVTLVIQEIAKRAFLALSCQGMARVDFFLRGDEVYLNEINTIPGFTKTSAYPKLWEASGVSNQELVDELVQLALQAHQKNKRLKRNFH
jgi:D-alanine-D-alanine ligase